MEQFKRAKVVMLPTESFIKGSLIQHSDNKKLQLITNPNFDKENAKHLVTTKWNTAFNIYIISDDEIKEGDWCYLDGIISQARNNEVPFEDGTTLEQNGWKKIIATTDTSLKIKTFYEIEGNQEINLPQPSQQFIEKFIESYNKGEVITDVLVEYEIDVKTADYAIQQLKLKVNPKDNTITIKRLKNSWNREEVKKELRTMHINLYGADKYALEQVEKWIEKHL